MELSFRSLINYLLYYPLHFFIRSHDLDIIHVKKMPKRKFLFTKTVMPFKLTSFIILFLQVLILKELIFIFYEKAPTRNGRVKKFIFSSNLHVECLDNDTQVKKSTPYHRSVGSTLPGTLHMPLLSIPFWKKEFSLFFSDDSLFS